MGVLEGKPMIRIVGTVIGFVLAFIGSCILWNDSGDTDLSDDAEAATNYFLFTLWIQTAICIAAVVFYNSEGIHNALVVMALAVFAYHFSGMTPGGGDPEEGPIFTTSFSGLTFVRVLLDDNDNDTLQRLFAGGFFAICGMLLGLISSSMKINISESAKMVKFITLGVVFVCGFIAVLMYWAPENIRSPFNFHGYNLSASVMIVMFTTLVAVLGTHKGAANFLFAFGGFFSVFALALGLGVSSQFSGEDRDTARAGMVFATVTSLVSLVPAALIIKDGEE
eukprot:gene3778-6300_t